LRLIPFRPDGNATGWLRFGLYNGSYTASAWRTCIRTHNLCIVGFGNVGKAFVALLQEKEQELRDRYGIAWRVTGVAARRLGWLAAPTSFAAEKLLAGDFSGAQQSTDIREWLRLCKADVVFEVSSLNAGTGQPATDYIRAALEIGAHAISANKGPVVHAWRELTELARSNNRRFLHESAMMDGVPIFSLFRETLPAIEIRGFRGVLNSTTTVILDAMGTGMSFDDAVREAQRLGVAETDPSNDVDGIDAAVKIVGLTTVLMNGNLKLKDVQRQGIRGIGTEQLSTARASGEVWRLVSRARRAADGNIVASVAPERLQASDPLSTVRGTSLLISFETDIFPQLLIGECNPGPQATAYGLLADFIYAVRSA
jgi:homoserine dehydrogenase